MNKEGNKMNEDGLKTNTKKFKATTKDAPNIGINVSNDQLTALIDNMESSSVDETTISVFRTLSENREYQYKTYDEMATDIVISSALDLYSDNCTEYNQNGDIIWASSEDSDIAKRVNRLIEQLKLNESSWGNIYGLIKYGDIYIETFRRSEIEEQKLNKQNFKTNIEEKQHNQSLNEAKSVLLEDIIVNIYGENDRLEEYVEPYSNPAEIFDLVKRGKTVGFMKVRTPTDPSSTDKTKPTNIYEYKFNSQDMDLYDPTKFVHITLNNPSNRNPEKVRLLKDTVIPDSKKDDKRELAKYEDALEFRVKKGKSILYDVYKIYREMKLLEDSILLNRVVRSALVRIIQVEVGDMAKTQIRQLLGRVKQLFEQKTALNEGGSVQEYANTPPVENNIYVPTKNNIGSLSVSNLGGDVNVGELTDLDYFNNKLFAGLKIPKPFLGFMDDNAGFSGGESLAKVSSSFAKTIKRVQNAYIQGIKTLINILFLDKGMSQYVNKFDIKMVSPSTLEDGERNETKNVMVDTISNIMGLFDDVEDTPYRLKILNSLLSEKLDEPQLSGIFQEYIEKLEKKGEEELDMENEESEDFEETEPNPDLMGIENDLSKGKKPDTGGQTPEAPDKKGYGDEEDELPTPDDLGVSLDDSDAVSKELGD